jgi:hypothetical protein
MGKWKLGKREEAVLLELWEDPFGDLAADKPLKRGSSKVGRFTEGVPAADLNRLWALERKGLTMRIQNTRARWRLTPQGEEIAKVLLVRKTLISRT